MVIGIPDKHKDLRQILSMPKVNLSQSSESGHGPVGE